MIDWIVIGTCMVGAFLSWLVEKKFRVLSKASAVATVAAVIAIGLSVIVTPLAFPSETVPITITAANAKNELSQGTEIFVKRFEVDGKHYVPQSVLDKGWVSDNDGQNLYGWRDYNPDDLPMTINGSVPQGKQVVVVLQQMMWRGIAEVTINEQLKTVDCYADTDDVTNYFTIVFDFPAYEKDIARERIHKLIVFACSFVMLVAVGMCLVFTEKRREEKREAVYEIWGDILRIIASFTVVWLHNTCNSYTDMSDITKWGISLCINSFTAFAVPCFYMLSGAFLLGHKQSIDTVIKKRIPILLVPLIAWTVVFVMINKLGQNSDINVVKSLVYAGYTNQFAHLWYLYALIGLYLILPLLSGWFIKADTNEKLYIFAFAYVFPALVLTAAMLRGHRLDAPMYAQLFPDFGIFLLGGILYENREKISGKRILSVGVTVIGFCMVAVCAYYTSISSGVANKDWFQWSKLPVTVFSAGLFSLFVALEPVFQQCFSQGSKRLVRNMSGLTLGIYLIHPIFANSSLPIGVMILTNNSPSQLINIALTVVHFVASVSLSFCISRIPLLRRTV